MYPSDRRYTKDHEWIDVQSVFARSARIAVIIARELPSLAQCPFLENQGGLYSGAEGL